MTNLPVDPNKVHLAEKDIEDWLYNNPQIFPGLARWVGRQVRVPSGIIDLLGVDKQNDPVVVEVKNVELSADAILQVCRYAADIDKAVRLIPENEFESRASKIVVFKGDVSAELQYEANAVNVALVSFSVTYSLTVGGPWTFKQAKREIDQEAIEQLALNEVFRQAYIYAPSGNDEDDEGDNPETDNTGIDEIPEAFQEFIEKHDGEEGKSEE